MSSFSGDESENATPRRILGLCEYARELENDRIKRIGRANELILERERSNARIAELESALLPFSAAWLPTAGWPDMGLPKFHDFHNAWLVRQGDAPNVWSDEVIPGGFVCGTCGLPTETEPCAEHQPQAYSQQ